MITLERRDTDTSKSYAALCDYAAMGPGRSIDKLLQIYNRSVTEEPPTRQRGTLGLWSGKHDWQARVAAYDAALAAEDRAAREAALAERRAAWVQRHMEADEVLALLADQARSSMADFLRIERVQFRPRHPVPDPTDDDPRQVRWVEDPIPQERLIVTTDLEQARDRGVLHLVKKYTDGRDGLKLELYSAYDARVKIGEHHKLFGKTDDILKYIDLSKLSPEQLSRIAKGEDPLAVLLAS